MRWTRALLYIGLATAVMTGCNSQPNTPKHADREEWVELFNGQDLDDWIIKIAGSPPGENTLNTFRLEDGKIVVSYDQYDELNGRWGHIFYKEPFSHYRIEVEYRFVGEQVAGAPEWAIRNNGIMYHAQSPIFAVGVFHTADTAFLTIGI